MTVQFTLHGVTATFTGNRNAAVRRMNNLSDSLQRSGYVAFYLEPAIERYVCKNHNNSDMPIGQPRECVVLEISR
jgi:hypothetical protein